MNDKPKPTASFESRLVPTTMHSMDDYWIRQGEKLNRSELIRRTCELFVTMAIRDGLATQQYSLIDSYKYLVERGLVPNPKRAGAMRKGMADEARAKDFAPLAHPESMSTDELAKSLIKEKEDTERLEADRVRLTTKATTDDQPKLNDNEETKAVFDNKDVGMPEVVDDINTTSKKSKRRKKS